MKSLNFLFILIALAASSCNTNKNEENKTAPTVDEVQALSTNFNESYGDTAVTLSIGKNKIVYLAVSYRHEKISNGFEIFDRNTDELAARFITNQEAKNSGWNNDQKVFSIKEDSTGAEIVVENLDLSAELIYQNIGKVQRDFSKEILGNQLIIKNKFPETDGAFIKRITDAPLLFRPDTIQRLAPTKAAMFDYKVEGKYNLVRRNIKNKSELETFDVIESADLTKVDASGFKVESKVEKLNNGYSLIEFRVSNPSVDTAFLITNPLYTVDFKCREVGNPFAVLSYREGVNTIVVKAVVQSSTRSECLDVETDKLEGFLFIYDVNLKNLKINY